MDKSNTSDRLIDSNDVSTSKNYEDPYQDVNPKLQDSMYPSRMDNSVIRSATKEISLHDDSYRLLKLHQSLKSSWVDRTFSPIQPGSIRGSIFTLMSTALGVGVLSLPYAVSTIGLGLGLLFLFISGIVSIWSLHLIGKASFRKECSKYSEAVFKTLGKGWSFVFQLVILTYTFGTLVTYEIALNKFVCYFLSSINVITREESDQWVKGGSSEYWHSYMIIGISACICFPIAVLRTVGAMRYLTLFGTVAMVYTMIVIVAQTPYYIGNWKSDVQITWYKFSWQTIVGWAIFTFAFCCHANVFPVKAELQYPQRARFNKISNRVMVSLLFIYSLVSTAGYLSFPDGPVQIYVNRPAEGISLNDIFMTISKGMMIINLIIAIPLNLNPCRLEVLILLGKEKNTGTGLHVLVTSLILFGSAGIAMLIPNIVQAIGIIGGICSTALSFTFPGDCYLKYLLPPISLLTSHLFPTFLVALMYLKVSNLPKFHFKRMLVWIIGGVTTIAGLMSAGIVTLQLAGILEQP